MMWIIAGWHSVLVALGSTYNGWCHNLLSAQAYAYGLSPSGSPLPLKCHRDFYLTSTFAKGDSDQHFPVGPLSSLMTGLAYGAPLGSYMGALAFTKNLCCTLKW